MPELTPSILAANIVGALGYLLFALSPLARTRLRYLVVHGVAMLPIAAHYVMLSAIPGAVLSLVYLGADILGGKWPGRLLPLVLLGLAAIGLLAVTYEDAADLLGLSGTLVFIASRMLTGHRATLAVAAASTVTWGAYGWFENSLSQVGFSVAYAVFCIYSLWRIGAREETGRAPPPPA